jgi:pyridoxamine 5'-phosphate oxidase
MDLSELRKEYADHGLDRHELREDPLEQFHHWFSQAKASGIVEPNAMVLSTSDHQGCPTSRTVLLKAADKTGLCFFTNYGSRKGAHLARDARATLLFPWFALERQVHITGSVTKTSEEESIAYFGRRPYGSQLGALVSEQSQTIPDRKHLEERLAELRAKHPEGKVPKPRNWGGYRLIPESFEFWQGRTNRLHDRFLYLRGKDGAWTIQRLAP